MNVQIDYEITIFIRKFFQKFYLGVLSINPLACEGGCAPKISRHPLGPLDNTSKRERKPTPLVKNWGPNVAKKWTSKLKDNQTPKQTIFHLEIHYNNSTATTLTRLCFNFGPS